MPEEQVNVIYPLPIAGTNYMALATKYWWVGAIAVGAIVLMMTMGKKSPKVVTKSVTSQYS